MTRDDQVALQREVLAAVAACPDRGNVLPVSLQPEGCHRCGERTECRAGRGRALGAATMEECVRCRHDALYPAPAP